MVEPTKEQDPAQQITPTPVADPVVSQPTIVVPDTTVLESKIKEFEDREKRHREQLKGKDKLIQELSIKKIVASMEPDYSEPPIANNEPKVVEPPKTVSSEAILRGTIENSIFINRLKMQQEFKTDSRLPFTDEIALVVEEKLQELDPTGRAKMNKHAWEAAYKMVIADRTSDIVEQEVKKVRDSIAAQQQKEAASFVEPVAPVAADPIPSVTMEDVMSGKVKMSTEEMLGKFPELKAQYSPAVLKMMGIK